MAEPHQTPEMALRAWIEALQGGGPSSAPREPAATRLAHWIDWTDAIELAAVLDSRTPAGARAGAQTHAARKMTQGHSLVSEGRQRALMMLRTVIKETVEDASRGGALGDAMVWRHGVARAQRQMEAAVSRLRAQLREALSQSGSAMRELAALDAVLEQALVQRQRHLLAGAAGRLARLGENASPSETERHLMAALSAELELRLQPLQGLAQALQDTDSLHS